MSDLLLSAPVEIQAAAADSGTGDEPKRVSILGYSGGAMNVPGWGSVVIDLCGLVLPSQVPLLSDHQAVLAGIVGHGSPSVRNGQLTVSGVITPTSEPAKQILDLARSGLQFSASVGIEPIEQEAIRPGESVTANGKTTTAGRGGFTLIRRGRLKEVSIVAVAADSQTRVDIAASAAQRRSNRMSTETQDTMTAAWDAPGLTDQQRMLARYEAFQTEFGSTVPDAGPRLLRAAMGGGLSWPDFSAEVLQAENRVLRLSQLRASRPTGPAIHGGDRRPATGDALQAACLIHFGRESVAEKLLGSDVAQRGRDLRCHNFIDVMRAALLSEGREVPANQDALIRASFSTYNLPNALGNSAEKIAFDAYSESPDTWRSWCKVLDARNFKEHLGLRLSDSFPLQQVPAAGLISHGRLEEATFPYSIRTYAKMIGISRQDIINDDIQMFGQIPEMFGRAAARKVADIVYQVLLANTGSFFSGANGNYLSGGTSVLSHDALASAIATLRNQVDVDGSPIALVPKVLLVGPTLEDTARQLLFSTTMARDTTSTDQLPMGNPLAGLNLTLEIEPRLEAAAFVGSSATQWYLSCGPQDGLMVVSFLNGKESPTVEQGDTDFNTLGLQFRVYHDFGAALADGKAGVFSVGL